MKKRIVLKSLAWIVGSTVVAGLVFWVAIQKITTINCLQNDLGCSSETYEKLDALKNKSLFTDNQQISQILSDSDLRITDIGRKFPGTLVVETQGQLRKIESSSSFNKDELAIVANSEYNQEQLDILVEELDKLAIPATSIVIHDENAVEIELVSGKIALADLEEPKVQLKKLQLILNNLDMDSIDLAIKEIDVRYRLPVLRTKLTFGST